MSANGNKRLYAALLAGAALAVVLVAALTAWAAQLGGGAWLPVLAPFAVVLLVPVAALARLHNAGTDAEPPEAPAGTGQMSVPASERDPAHRTTRRVA
jgi:hypothetical protein